MTIRRPGSLLLAIALAVSPLARAGAQAPNTLTGGSPDVFIGGLPESRQGDATTGGAPVVHGSPNVFINGRPAALAGGRVACGGAIETGAPNVFINGKAAARVGDKAGPCPGK